MAEPGSVTLENLNLNIDIKRAKPEKGLAALVGNTERQLRLGRMSESDIEGFFGVVEDATKFIGAELGLSQNHAEMKAFGNALKDKKAKIEVQNLYKSELEGKTADQQAEFLSGGMDSLKGVALKLMKVRSEAPELNGAVIGAELSRLATEYKSATAEDRKYIDKFMQDMLTARRDTLNGVKNMWQAQEDMDTVNRVREAIELGDKDIKPGEEYEFSMQGGVIRKTVSWLSRAVKPGTGLRRVGQGLRRASVRAKQETWARLDQLKAKALAIGSEKEDIAMWKAGIISVKELGLGSDQISRLQAESALTSTQAEMLREGREYKKYTNTSGEFVQVSETNANKFYEEFFGNRMKHAEVFFTQAREKYLQYDIANLKDENGIDILMGTAGVAADLAPLPRWFKSGVAKLSSAGVQGVLTGITGVAEGVQFGVDRVEAVIAGHALEKMTAIALSRKMVTDRFNGLLNNKETSEKDLLQAAKEVRGGWSVFERESALAAARAADLAEITENEELSIATPFLSAAEIAAGGLEHITGGVLYFGQNTKDVAEELKLVISKSVDGSGVMSKAEEPVQREIDDQKSLIESSRRNFGIPDEYLTMQGINSHLQNMFGGAVVERVRQALGPEAKLPFGLEDKLKGKEWWDVIAGGSRRASVADVTKKVAPRLAKANKLVNSFAGQTEGVHSSVEAATAVVLREALRKHASAEMKQIGERARLDKMGSDVLKISAAGAGLAAVAGIFAGIGAIASPWSEHAHIGMEKAVGEMGRLEAEFNKIPEIASQTHEKWAIIGGTIDKALNNVWVSLNGINWGISSGLDWIAPRATMITATAGALSPLVAWGRGMVEVVGRKVKPKTKLFAPNGQVK